MISAPSRERSRSAQSWRLHSVSPLSPGTSNLFVCFEIRIICKESWELSWVFHWPLTSLFIACLLRRFYASSDMTRALTRAPPSRSTSFVNQGMDLYILVLLCMSLIYSNLTLLTFQGSISTLCWVPSLRSWWNCSLIWVTRLNSVSFQYTLLSST